MSRSGTGKGARTSSIMLPSFRLLTVTAILCGLRKPALINSDTASLIEALNKPVRRCFGNSPKMVFSWGLKPRSNSRSASSMTSTSRLEVLTRGDESSSARRPGVAMMRLGDFRTKKDKSARGFVKPAINSWGTMTGSLLSVLFSS